jgi:hypothetical protein
VEVKATVQCTQKDYVNSENALKTRKTCPDDRNHLSSMGLPTSEVSLPAWKNSVKTGATYKSRTKMPFNFACGRYVIDEK